MSLGLVGRMCLLNGLAQIVLDPLDGIDIHMRTSHQGRFACLRVALQHPAATEQPVIFTQRISEAVLALIAQRLPFVHAVEFGLYLGDVERMDTLQKLSLAQLSRRQPEARWQPPAKLHHAATHVVFPEAFSGAFKYEFETLLSLGTLRLAVFKLGADTSGVLRQIIKLANL